MALTAIQQVKLLVADLDAAFPLLSDESYDYFLTKNSGSVNRAALDAAKTILLVLSQRTSETVDIFTISGGQKSAEQYRLSLQMFLKNPELNPVLTSAGVYAGGISLSDMQANVNTLDNNAVHTANEPTSYTHQPLGNPFVV